MSELLKQTRSILWREQSINLSNNDSKYNLFHLSRVKSISAPYIFQVNNKQDVKKKKRALETEGLIFKLKKKIQIKYFEI